MLKSRNHGYYSGSTKVNRIIMSLAAVTSHLQQTLDPVVSRFIKPRILSSIATRMPRKLNYIVVEKLLNNAFAEQIGEGDFEFLEGRVLQVEIIDANLFIGLSFNHNKIICNHFNNLACTSDATLSIDTLNAINLVQQEVDPDTLFFQRKLKINGDTELAHHVKNTIDTLDPEVIPGFMLKLMEQYKLRAFV